MAPEPETSSPEPNPKPESSAEPKTLFPEIMTNQEAFLMYGVFIFALAVFCIILLVLFILLKKKRLLQEKEEEWQNAGELVNLCSTVRKIASSLGPMDMKIQHGI